MSAAVPPEQLLQALDTLLRKLETDPAEAVNALEALRSSDPDTAVRIEAVLQQLAAPDDHSRTFWEAIYCGHDERASE